MLTTSSTTSATTATTTAPINPNCVTPPPSGSTATPILDSYEVNHTAQWEQNRKNYNEQMNPDRSASTFWAGEKFVINVEFITENNVNFSTSPLLKSVKIKDTSYQAVPSTDITTPGKIKQTASVWNKDMISSLNDYPLLSYLNYGIKVTLNTDDPAIEGTDIVNEHNLMKKHIGLTKEQQIIILNNSINAAFTSDEVKNKLREEILK